VAPAVAGACGPAALRDEATALEQLGGDRELLDELVQMYMADLPAQLAEFQAPSVLNDLPRLSKLAHAQKGAAGAVGATAARACASALETACYAADAAMSAQQLALLVAAMLALQQEHLATDPVA
jgi:HPt (histidine-containing phosphotransfer) domain-containing protein